LALMHEGTAKKNSDNIVVMEKTIVYLKKQ
jgi:hypothetical protein